MSSADLVAWRTPYAAALDEPGWSEDALLAFHHEMNQMLDSAGCDFGLGFRFGTPDRPSWTAAWSSVALRVGRIAISAAEGGQRHEDRTDQPAVRKRSTERQPGPLQTNTACRAGCHSVITEHRNGPEHLSVRDVRAGSP